MLLFAVSEVPGRDTTCGPAQTVGRRSLGVAGGEAVPTVESNLFEPERPSGRRLRLFGPGAAAPLNDLQAPTLGSRGACKGPPERGLTTLCCAARTPFGHPPPEPSSGFRGAGRGARRGVFGSTCSPALALRAISSADIRPGPTRSQRARFALSRSTRSWVLAEEGRSLVPLARDPWSDQHAPRDPSVWVRLRRHTRGPPCLRFAQTALRRNHLVILLGPQQAVGRFG